MRSLPLRRPVEHTIRGRSTEFRHSFDVMLFGGHAVARAFLPHMRSRGSGQILNITIFRALTSTRGGGMYSTAKAAADSASSLFAHMRPDKGLECFVIR